MITTLSYRPFSKCIVNKYYWHIFIDQLKTQYPNNNFLPLLGSAHILWCCIQHSDEIAKSHLVLLDPIKSNGGNSDVLVYGPECTTMWMSPKSQKNTILLWTSDSVASFSERKKKKDNFIHVSGILHIFSFVLIDRGMNHLVLWSWK